MEAETLTRAAGMASRSAAQDPVIEALQHAREAHREFTRNTRAALSGVATARRPFGVAVRNEPVTCPECLKLDVTPTESFVIHHPELLPAMGQEPVTVPDDTEQRSAYASGAEITRGDEPTRVLAARPAA